MGRSVATGFGTRRDGHHRRDQVGCLEITAPPTARHVVSVLTVRNADLPRAMDGFCAAVGRLLERDLTDVPNLMVLERSDLERLNQERELPTTRPVTNNLLAAVIQLQVDVSGHKWSRVAGGGGVDRPGQ